jgi:hypothetical protein
MSRVQRAAWVVWILLVVAGVGRAALYDQVRHRGSYEVFQDGGRYWLAGQPVYDVAHPESLCVFRYSPLWAAAFTPLGLMPAPAGSAVLRLANFIVLLLGMAWWGSRVLGQSPERGRQAHWWLLTALAAGGTLLDVQLNLFTLGLMLIGMAALEARRWNLSAATIGLAVCCKAYPISLALVLVLVYPRRFAPRFAVALLALLALPFVLQHPVYVAEQYHDWLHGGLNARYTSGGWFQDAMYLWCRWVGGPSLDRTTYLLAAAAVGALIALAVLRRRGRVPATDLHVSLFGMCLAWMMAFGPATEAKTYVMLTPAAALVMLRVCLGGPPLWWRLAGGAAYTLLTLSVLQLLFPLNKPLHHLGAQPFAALLLLPIFLCWRSLRPAEAAPTIAMPLTLRAAA